LYALRQPILKKLSDTMKIVKVNELPNNLLKAGAKNETTSKTKSNISPKRLEKHLN
jgi:hypothetical protein